MRIAPEWVDYDHEIKKLWQRINPPVTPKIVPSETTTTTTTPATTGSSPRKASPLMPSAPEQDVFIELNYPLSSSHAPTPGCHTTDPGTCSASTCTADSTQSAGFKPPVPQQTPVSKSEIKSGYVGERARGGTGARLTPDQKVAYPNHVGLILVFPVV
ncbi:unnamed protein product [Echinostoma caproni]|uniref:Uncharacterized protein n=1 Tax=Echinostoma caproni TaxID=27848 RepID=A0A183AWW6_9TREM|nr:unnamed protein product [Echinostoma caproni]